MKNLINVSATSRVSTFLKNRVSDASQRAMGQNIEQMDYNMAKTILDFKNAMNLYEVFTKRNGPKAIEDKKDP